MFIEFVIAWSRTRETRHYDDV